VQGLIAGPSPTMEASSPVDAPCLGSSPPGFGSALSDPSGGPRGVFPRDLPLILMTSMEARSVTLSRGI
jgi:hypothetical protein